MSQLQLPFGSVSVPSRRKSKKAALAQVLDLIAKPVRDKESIHTLFSYPAKFQASVPKLILEYFSEPGDLVLDPFGGGGTTSAACKTVARSSVHYDLNPISCMVAKAKTQHISRKDYERALGALKVRLPKAPRAKLLTDEESQLFGPNVSTTANHVYRVMLDLVEGSNASAPMVAALLFKFLKLCGRRDAQKRREQDSAQHLRWLEREFSQYYIELHEGNDPRTRHDIVCASNHALRIKDGSADLIITSPPYSGVDVEYNEIQIQRRDLRRCYRSDVGVRIANAFFAGEPQKRQLCDGGVAGISNYFDNARKSLIEMRRVLKRGGFAFVYCGFKTIEDARRYEGCIRDAGFEILERGTVKLSDDRVASSRSTHHGKDTQMMKQDFLYILR